MIKSSDVYLLEKYTSLSFYKNLVESLQLQAFFMRKVGGGK